MPQIGTGFLTQRACYGVFGGVASVSNRRWGETLVYMLEIRSKKDMFQIGRGKEMNRGCACIDAHHYQPKRGENKTGVEGFGGVWPSKLAKSSRESTTNPELVEEIYCPV